MRLHDPKDDPPYYKTICDNFFPLYCPACGINFEKDYMGLAKHYDIHYTKTPRGKKKV